MNITFSHVWKAYGTLQVLRDVSFSLMDGEIVCLTAPSGQGKTTLLRLLLGLEEPDKGEISGLDGLRYSAVFQEDRLLDHLTAAENLKFVLGRSFDASKAQELLTELGLGDSEDKPVGAFSGGMRRRVALARALSVPFDLLILDEPFTGLDDQAKRAASDCILRRRKGKTTVLVSHDKSEASGLGALVLPLESLMQG